MTLIKSQNTHLQKNKSELPPSILRERNYFFVFSICKQNSQLLWGWQRNLVSSMWTVGSNLHITSIRFHTVKTLKYMLNEKMQSHKPLLSRMVNTNWPLIEQGVIKYYNKKSPYILFYLSSQYCLPNKCHMQDAILGLVHIETIVKTSVLLKGRRN